MNTTAEIHEAANGLVVSHPGILGGKPVFRGTRLPVATLFEYLADGLTLDYFLETFPSVRREQATDTISQRPSVTTVGGFPRKPLRVAGQPAHGLGRMSSGNGMRSCATDRNGSNTSWPRDPPASIIEARATG